MTTYLTFEYAHDDSLPPGTDEVRTPPALVEHFLDAETDPGDAVFDPFAGYGTTLAIAERLGRAGHGVEFESDRVDYIEDRLDAPERIRQGDILEADLSWVPDCELVFTSPPFMVRTDDRNPFENYAGESSYEEYLDDIQRAFARLDSLLAPGGRVIIDVVNMKYEGRVTPLAWDIAEQVRDVFHFDGEVVVTWENADTDDGEDRDGRYGYGYDHSYCLTFTKRE